MYNVVFVYTEKAGGYEGVRTWSSWPTKEAFQEDYNTKWTEEMKEKEQVVEEGISEERCLELADQTPSVCHITAGLQEMHDFFELVDNVDKDD